MEEKITDKVKALRKESIKANKEITSYMKCHPKTLHKIERKMIDNPYIRYFMFLRKNNNVDLNTIFDQLVKEDVL